MSPVDGLLDRKRGVCVSPISRRNDYAISTGNVVPGMADPRKFVQSSDEIFANKELLEINHLPDDDRIVGRDDQIEQLVNTMNPAVFGQSPSNALLYGKTGTGKSLCAKHVSRTIAEVGHEEGVNVQFAYVDCAQDPTETQTVQSIASAFNDEDETGISVPEKGIGTSIYYKRLWRILDKRADVALIILDEIDKLDSDDVLMQLTRAGEAGKIKNCKIGVIGISNKIKYKDRMDERVKSSLCEREYIFPPYDANQLRDIMFAREDAFHDGVLEDGVIPRTAALAAREHGDARKAIDMLRYAGEIAQSREVDLVKEEFVNEARNRAENDRFRELIRGATPHSRYVLHALATLSLNHEDKAQFRTTAVYDMYEEVCEKYATDPLSLRRVRDLLKEHAFLDVVERSNLGGGTDGVYTAHRLVEDPETVQEVLVDTE
jgi:cell division control protein 6